ncbi:MAG: hypothetical protein AB1430_22330, partial [Pseudomonadota bacterium]
EGAARLQALLAAGSAFAQRQGPCTQTDVAALMQALYPPASGRPGERSQLRQQLTSAFLAGVAHSQDELLLRPVGSFVEASIHEARTLLKNRAASQASRLWHAFNAGARAARATMEFPLPQRWVPACTARLQAEPLKVFIRQPFTESGDAQQELIAEVLQRIAQHEGRPHALRYLTGRQAESAETFKASFEAESGQAFTPRAFRAWRLGLLDQADAFINIRVGMSESSAFELSYHVFRGACTPVLFLVWKHSPIKTTLLKDLGNLCDVTYLEFGHADELDAGLAEFFRRCRSPAATA